MLFRPTYEDAHPEYVDAKKAGEYGVDCLTMYPKCPKGSGLLDSISYFRSE